MQVYGLKLHNVFRFGEKDNCVVFDVSEQDRELLKKGLLTFDELYMQMISNPILWVKHIKENGVTSLISILGCTAGDFDRSNGVGKSALLEGICYAFYEKIVRCTSMRDKVEKAGNVIVTQFNGEFPASLTQSYVEIVFEDNGKVYWLKRGRSFSKTKKTYTPILEFKCYHDTELHSQTARKKTETEQNIEDVIQMDYDVFVNSLMFGQNDAGKFLKGTDKTRKEMLISILQLEDIVHGCLDIVRTKRNQQKKAIDAHEIQKDILQTNEEKRAKELGLEAEFSFSAYKAFLKGKHAQLHKEIEASKELVEDLQKQVEQLQQSDAIKQGTQLEQQLGLLKQALQDKQKVHQEQGVQLANMLQLYATDIHSSNDKIERLRKSVTSEQKNLDTLKETVGSFDQLAQERHLIKLADAVSRAPQELEHMEAAEKKQNGLRQELGGYNSAIIGKEQDVGALSKQIKDLGPTDQFTCRECKSVVSRQHVEGLMQECSVALEGLRKEKTQVMLQIAKANDVITSLKTKHEQHRNMEVEKVRVENSLQSHTKDLQRINELETSITSIIKEGKEVTKHLKETQSKKDSSETDMEKHTQRCKEESQELQEQIDQVQSKLQAVLESATPINQEIATKRKALEDAKTQHNSTEKKMGRLLEVLKSVRVNYSVLVLTTKKIEEDRQVLMRYEVLDDVFGLDGLQTRLISKYLPLLNSYIKEFLDVLSDGSMRVALFVNHKGKIDVGVEGGTANTYEMCSGGEKVLIRLSVDIGLGLLSFSRAAKQPEAIFLDEVLGALDNHNTECMLRMLTVLEKRFGRVLIISHKPFVNEMIEDNILIEKESGEQGLSRIVGMV